MIKVWKKQFTRENFFLTHSDPYVFLQSQWQQSYGPNLFYIGYRWAVALTFLIIWILSTIFSGEYDVPIKWTIYLTNWGLTICTFQALVAALMVSVWIISHVSKDGNADENKKPLYLMPYKIYWASNTIATDLAFLITIVYWSLLYDSSAHELDTMNVMTHGVNSCLMFLDLLMLKHPVFLVHFYLPVLFGIVYLIFSVIYWSAGGTDRFGNSFIYTILNWDKPGTTAAYCVGVLVFFLILHTFTFCIYSLRIHVFNTLVNKKGINTGSADGNYGMKVYENQGMNIKEEA